MLLVMVGVGMITILRGRGERGRGKEGTGRKRNKRGQNRIAKLLRPGDTLPECSS